MTRPVSLFKTPSYDQQVMDEAVARHFALLGLDDVCTPGKKVLIKGNHDFWHGSLKRTRDMLTNETYFVQNDSVRIGDYTFVGTRGWPHPGDDDYSPQDEKIYAREQERLRLSLDHARRIGGKIVGLIHYPPFTGERKGTPFTRLFEEYGVEKVVFGHIHGEYTKNYPQGPLRLGEVDYYLTSCDHLDFKLKQIL